MNRIGEVVEASTTEFIVQSYALYEAPSFGALVRTGNPVEAIYGVVFRTETLSIDPGRRPIARGRDAATEADLYRDNPQLPKLLRTDFHCVIVGGCRGDQPFQHLPPQPPRVHGFVYPCDAPEIRRFTERLDFFQIIANAGVPAPSGELLAAVAREAAQARDLDETFLLAAGEALVPLFGDDLQLLTAVLRRLSPS